MATRDGDPPGDAGRDAALPMRAGPRPRTTPTNPHTQLDQQPDRSLIDSLAERIFALPHVEERPSAISVPGARALWLEERVSAGPSEAFIVGREFAHLHPEPDGSLHASLPARRAVEAIAAGWAELHPLARHFHPGLVMIYAPRDLAEVQVVAGLIKDSYRFARGA